MWPVVGPPQYAPHHACGDLYVIFQTLNVPLIPFTFSDCPLGMIFSCIVRYQWHNKQEAQLMLTNPRDALRGQSWSQSMVQFDMFCYVWFPISVL